MFTPLEPAKILVERPIDRLRIVFINGITQLRITRDLFDTENSTKIIGLYLFFKPPLKLKQRWILEVKHRKAAHEAVIQAIFHLILHSSIFDELYMLSKNITQSAKS